MGSPFYNFMKYKHEILALTRDIEEAINDSYGVIIEGEYTVCEQVKMIEVEL